ncbi:3-oxoacyl-[acyl-carrier-protein] reductase FabG [Pseudovibrio axinellae]|uniref:3-oxoacyl-[acyl-carrier-protein] reductase FabG n=1 Tax=Pseudovibrio axinellae TaxID=989403 RepID=A0A165VQ29_9HYPH|nr:SDR family oxidoreductase [Pseudovibrio axinellae]KZL15098.1 3-oxoacyl-[acyl-carrier-protein] reductase FabG [Pseudovibrio axinellae]SER92693.1 3-oxoacyl-[acyl-carrier protein] reductase [Pseudovibrio axinellae]
MSTTENRTAIITGSSRGIGATIAEHLAAGGFNVVINYVGNENAARQVVEKIRATGNNAIAVQADVSDAAAVKRMFEMAEKTFGGVDVLVNNAGIMKLATIAESDDALFDSLVAINFKGTFNPLRQAAKRLRNGGAIVNFSTSVVGLKLETYGVYAAIKAAVETMTAIMAKELRGRSITVNAVAPGPTATQLFLDGKPQEVINRMSQMTPLERLGKPKDIAAVVAFLVGPDGAWINGQTVRANGGLV